MASKYRTKKGFNRTALAVALGVCFSGAVYGQANTAGAVGGQAASGDTITITNPATGFSRTVTVGSDGYYRFSSLPIGQYTVTRNGGNARSVTVNVGISANVDFVRGGEASLDNVTVVGATLVNPIDVASVESTTILTAEQIQKIPVAQDTTSVALLAPGTVKGDAAFGNLASFGGSSVAENQYYINGFNITNSFRSLNFAQVPFEAIQEQQIKTGGYGAEFGRSLGGVINQITKRGTNEFEAGGQVVWSPKSLREDVDNFYYANPLVSTDVGKLAEDNSEDTRDSLTTSVWAGGALIQDRLFAYGLISYRNDESDEYGDTTAFTNLNRDAKTPSWLLKLDWNINDNNLLEFTAFSDETKTHRRVYTNTPGTVDRGEYVGSVFDKQGGRNYILKYTGYFTDNFTLTALYGHGTFKRSQHLENPDGSTVSYSGDINDAYTTDIHGTTELGGCPVILDLRPGYRKEATGVYGSYCSLLTGSALLQAENNKDTRDQFRIDAEWVLGDHQIKFGIDIDNFESVAGEANPGGWLWRYSTSNPNGSTLPDGDEVDVVRRQTTARGATVEVKQRAFYVEDSWHITDNFIAYLGGRWDTFKNLNGEGDAYVEIKNQFGPRLGFAWDVNGDSTFKVYGNAGRYALPLTPSVAVRSASASIYQRSSNNPFDHVDPVTGVPLDVNGDPITIKPLTLINGEDGNAHDPLTVASTNLKPMYQDEYILGVQKTLTDHLTGGARGIYRDLKAAIDDNCDYSPIAAAADAAGLPYTVPNPGFPYCRMFNPGEDAVYITDLNGDGHYTELTIPGELLAPKAKRTYRAIELFLDGNYERGFFQASYTWAKSQGNTEGGVKSDIGQADTNVTQDFDYKELAVDSYGYLPNDRRHALKVFGNYDITDEWSIGANFLAQSGRPLNCLGVLYPYNGGIHPYGSSFFRCGTTPAGGRDGPSVAVPRGTAGRLPWTNSLDLNVAYRPEWAPGLTLKVDVFNVMNHQKVTAVSEVAEDSATGAPLNTYLLPRSFQEPRSVRFTVRYDFKAAATVAPVAVVEAAPAKTCADLDDDGDGVNNCNDKCMASPAGQAVAADGCPVPAVEPEPVMEPKPYRN
jgi:hypothetical protein